MDLGWVVLGLVGWALGVLFVLVLVRMAGDEDRAARRLEKRLFPHSDVTVTRAGPEVEDARDLELAPRLHPR